MILFLLLFFLRRNFGSLFFLTSIFFAMTRIPSLTTSWSHIDQLPQCGILLHSASESTIRATNLSFLRFCENGKAREFSQTTERIWPFLVVVDDWFSSCGVFFGLGDAKILTELVVLRAKHSARPFLDREEFFEISSGRCVDDGTESNRYPNP
jgi:hypothetical protein